MVAPQGTKQLFLWPVGLILIAAADAYAYVDPGTGSLILQLLLGLILAASFKFRGLLRRLLTSLAKFFPHARQHPRQDGE